MTNPMFVKVLDALDKGLYFNHSIEELVKSRLAEMSDDEKDRVNVVVVGDRDITNKLLVTRNLTNFLRIFEKRENIRLITGYQPGIESIVNQYAKKNSIECINYKTSVDKNEWRELDVDEQVPNIQKRNESMIKHAHVILFMTFGFDKYLDNMYHLSRDNGLLVAKCQFRRRQ
jgi:hypothetical protein